MAELIASLTLTVVCLAIGVRLLRLAQRTRQAPEFLIGASFFLAGFVSNTFNLIRVLAPLSESARAWLFAGAAIALYTGMLCVAAFTWRVFRPTGRIGAALCATSAVGLVVAAVAEIAVQWRLPDGTENPWTIWFTLPLRIAIYVWATYETLDYWWKLRRRARIGLADPLVVNRLFLWGFGLFAILVVWIRALMLAVGPVQGREVVGSVVTTALVLVCAASHWLAFFPPAAWRRRFAASASDEKTRAEPG